MTSDDLGTSATIALTQLPSTAQSLIVRWYCSDSGTFEFFVDGKPKATGPCSAEFVAATIPLSGTRPRTVHITGLNTRWRVTISEVG